jgi:DNA-binding MarR family transcriptional regulator
MTAGRKPDTDAGPAEIFAFFNEIGIIAQLSQALLAKVLPDGVHPSHFSIVNHLVRLGDGKPPAKIASAMQVTKATMTHSLQVLEKRGFIETRPSVEDARSKLVYLTEAGRGFQHEAITGVVAAFGQVLSAQDVAVMRDVMPGLVAIRKLLDDNRNP